MAREHVGKNILAIDAVEGKVAEDDRTKFDYLPTSFITKRVQVVVGDNLTAVAADKQCGIVPVRGAIGYDLNTSHISTRLLLAQPANELDKNIKSSVDTPHGGLRSRTQSYH